MKILKDRITLCDLEPDVAEMVYQFINELSGMLDEGLVIEHINKFNTIKIGDKFNIQVEMTRGAIKNE